MDDASARALVRVEDGFAAAKAIAESWTRPGGWHSENEEQASNVRDQIKEIDPCRSTNRSQARVRRLEASYFAHTCSYIMCTRTWTCALRRQPRNCTTSRPPFQASAFALPLMCRGMIPGKPTPSAAILPRRPRVTRFACEAQVILTLVTAPALSLRLRAAA